MNSYIKNIHVNKKGLIATALHVLIWIMVFLIPYIFSAGADRDFHSPGNDRDKFLYLNTALNFFWVALFYLNAGVLMPRLLYTKKIAWYIVSIGSMFVIMILLDAVLFRLLFTTRNFSIYHSVGNNFIPFVFTIAVGAAYKAIADKTKADLVIKEKQSEHLKTELSFLRSQVNPHFLFNVLNNIVALVRLKSNDLEPTVMKLSSLMHYMLYETDEEKVAVQSETEYLQAYIDLQQQRYGDELNLQVHFDIKESWQSIEPMLLIPFVENAFKHGGIIQSPEINVTLSTADNKLHFTVINTFEASNSIKDKTPGIGLANVKRRLELLYPDNHVLKINKQADRFIIDLLITLQ